MSSFLALKDAAANDDTTGNSNEDTFSSGKSGTDQKHFRARSSIERALELNAHELLSLKYDLRHRGLAQASLGRERDTKRKSRAHVASSWSPPRYRGGRAEDGVPVVDEATMYFNNMNLTGENTTRFLPYSEQTMVSKVLKNKHDLVTFVGTRMKEKQQPSTISNNPGSEEDDSQCRQGGDMAKEQQDRKKADTSVVNYAEDELALIRQKPVLARLGKRLSQFAAASQPPSTGKEELYPPLQMEEITKPNMEENGMHAVKESKKRSDVSASESTTRFTRSGTCTTFEGTIGPSGGLSTAVGTPADLVSVSYRSGTTGAKTNNKLDNIPGLKPALDDIVRDKRQDAVVVKPEVLQQMQRKEISSQEVLKDANGLRELLQRKYFIFYFFYPSILCY